MKIKNWHIALLCTIFLAVMPFYLVLELIEDKEAFFYYGSLSVIWFFVLACFIPSGLSFISTILLIKNKKSGLITSKLAGFIVIAYAIIRGSNLDIELITIENILFGFLPSIFLITMIKNKSDKKT